MKRTILTLLSFTSLCFANESMELLLSQDQIHQKIQEVASQINEEYKDKNLCVIMVMKGGAIVACDLVRQLNVPLTIEYMKASSYGQNGMQPGKLQITGLEGVDLSDKDLLIVDDIFDTGNTMVKILSELQEKNPRSMKSLVLLKKNVQRKVSYEPDYTLFDIDDRFVIGYGLDYKEYYRELPGICAFINDTPPSHL